MTREINSHDQIDNVRRGEVMINEQPGGFQWPCQLSDFSRFLNWTDITGQYDSAGCGCEEEKNNFAML